MTYTRDVTRLYNIQVLETHDGYHQLLVKDAKGRVQVLNLKEPVV